MKFEKFMGHGSIFSKYMHIYTPEERDFLLQEFKK